MKEEVGTFSCFFLLPSSFFLSPDGPLNQVTAGRHYARTVSIGRQREHGDLPSRMASLPAFPTALGWPSFCPYAHGWPRTSERPQQRKGTTDDVHRQPTHHRRARPTMLLATALSLWSMPALAQARPERLSDKDVKKLIDQVDEGRDKFEGNLDGKFKGSTLRGPSGEVKVSGALQDYQDNTQKLKDRFTPDYSASAEVMTVLKQSTAIDTFMQGAPSDMKGRNEWDRQTTYLKQLAASYGTTFPLPDGAPVRRMNDKETAGTAEAIASAAGRFKSDLDKATTLAKPDKDAAKKDTDLLIKQANAVKSRTSDGKLATGEMRQLTDQVAKLQTFVDGHPIPTMTNWQAVQSSLGKLQQAFGLSP